MLQSDGELLAIGEIISDHLLALLELSPVTNADNSWIVALMKRYAKESAQANVSLCEFAVSHQKNAQYIGRLFKKEVGMSFADYVNTVRLEKAANLLAKTERKIIDVAMLSGFQNVSYFNRLFRNKYGLSPSEYRKREKI